jgi:GNAT superfamily N-acetyltransferase
VPVPPSAEFLRNFLIEAFDSDRHDREAFASGKSRYDNFLKITASRFVRNEDGRLYVAVERGKAEVMGYYAVAPHAIDTAALDEGDRKRLPGGYDRIAAFILSMLAVDERVQGRGLGSLLLADMFLRCLAAADLVGGRFIVLDADDERAKVLYSRMGFRALPSDPRRMIISIRKVRASAGLRS